jgi:hypothetical protein
MSRFSDEERLTPAYCPKVFAGLKIARIPGPTKSRTIIVNMRPKTEDEKSEDEIDLQPLQTLKADIEAWSKSEATLKALEAVELGQDDIAFLNNRNRELWKPLLAVAKVCGDSWYQRALSAAKAFVTDEPLEKNLAHTILLGAYKVYRSQPGGNDKIHTANLLEALHDLGIPKWVDVNYLADCFAGYGVKPRQMRINSYNRNGYEWHTFASSFSTYITKREIEDVEKELGLRIDPVDSVDVIGTAPMKPLNAVLGGVDLRSTASTLSTFPTITPGMTYQDYMASRGKPAPTW